MDFSIEAIYEKYLERFEETFKELFPLIKNSNGKFTGGFNEVNQTVSFLAAAEDLYGFRRVKPWYELAIPNEYKIKNDNRIDGLLISKEDRTIIFVESKRYENDPFEKMQESEDDARRIEELVYSPQGLLCWWCKLEPKELENYRIYGVILGAIWPTNNTTRSSKKKDVFERWQSKEAMGNRDGEYYGVDRRIKTNNKDCDAKWNFYLPGFVWEIGIHNSVFSTTTKEENCDPIVESLLSLDSQPEPLKKLAWKPNDEQAWPSFITEVLVNKYCNVIQETHGYIYFLPEHLADWSNNAHNYSKTKFCFWIGNLRDEPYLRIAGGKPTSSTLGKVVGGWDLCVGKDQFPRTFLYSEKLPIVCTREEFENWLDGAIESMKSFKLSED